MFIHFCILIILSCYPICLAILSESDEKPPIVIHLQPKPVESKSPNLTSSSHKQEHIHCSLSCRESSIVTMGLFNNKKKESTPESGKGDYVAPSVAAATSSQLRTTPLRTTPDASLSQAQATVAVMQSFSTADPDAMSRVRSVQVAVEVVGKSKNPNTNADPQAAPQTAPIDVPLGSPDAPTSFDEPSVLSGRTGKTYPTLRSADSDDSKDSAFTITRNGQYLTLNGFANGHLMRWKFAAEEGPAFIRIPAVLLALGCIVTTAYPLVAFEDLWTIPLMICAVHTWILSLLIIVLEARVIGIRDPTNFRARIRGVITRYINVTRLVWGRGLLYIYAGSMNLTIDDNYVVYTAFPLMVLGVIAIGTGAHASYNLDRMKSSLTDEAFLWSKFEVNDCDNNNKIDVNGFAELLWSLGLEFDDVYTFKAFQQIDKNRDNKISFEQFKTWWIVTQNDGRRLRR
jgi:hypothetical protein